MNVSNKGDNMKLLAIRHGECLLFPIDNLPKGKTHQETRFIVGHSETGHHHALESKAAFTVLDVDKAFAYLQLTQPAKLVHQKTVNRHSDLVVPAGTYKIIHKTEYDPFQKIRREVWD